MEHRKEEELECAVCLQPCIHPVKLPCSHIFCFLCVKGVANQSKRCAMCRQEIPPDYLDNPDLLKEIKEKEAEGYQWFYEGRNGWWKYDKQTNEDLEVAFNKNVPVINLLLCGQIYSLDLVNLVQHPQKDPNKTRKIKRDLRSSSAKGIAGLTMKILNLQNSSNEKIEKKCNVKVIAKRGRKRKRL